jgi:hypothetical protein
MKTTLALITLIILCGCQTFYSSIIAVTDVRKSVMNEYGELYRSGNLTDATVAQVRAADAQYIMAAESMKLALLAYKAGTSTNDPALKLQDVKEPVKAIIRIITPLIGQVVADKHNNNLNKASKL